MTDPNDNDSDDDGLLDGAEVNTFISNPNNNDSDLDSLEDGEEVNEYGTSPTNSDSDGDLIGDYDEINDHKKIQKQLAQEYVVTRTYSIVLL